MHQMYDVKNLADLNLILFEAGELQIVQHRDAFDLEGDLENVLTREFLKTPNSNCLI